MVLTCLFYNPGADLIFCSPGADKDRRPSIAAVAEQVDESVAIELQPIDLKRRQDGSRGDNNTEDRSLTVCNICADRKKIL